MADTQNQNDMSQEEDFQGEKGGQSTPSQPSQGMDQDITEDSDIE
jgi:hypothetical protein